MEVFGLSRNDCDFINFNELKTEILRIRPDVIYNCAAHVGNVHYVTENAADIISDNILISINLYKIISTYF